MVTCCHQSPWLSTGHHLDLSFPQTFLSFHEILTRTFASIVNDPCIGQLKLGLSSDSQQSSTVNLLSLTILPPPLKKMGALQTSAGAEQQQSKVSRDDILAKSKYPVFLPYQKALHMTSDEFEDFIKTTVSTSKSDTKSLTALKETVSNAMGSVNAAFSGSATATPNAAEESSENVKGSPRAVSPSKRHASRPVSPQQAPVSDQGHPFMTALAGETSPRKRRRTINDLPEDQMLTENGDIAYRSTSSKLVDLFYELEDTATPARIAEMLEAAWKVDALATLKIIWNARSIHLGKGSRSTFYRCYGWLAENHPQTAIVNLRWLSRPTIPKKAEKKEEGTNADEDMVLIDEEAKTMSLENADTHRWDQKFGVSHGYWKDLLNLVALAANNELVVSGDFKKVFNAQRTRVGTKTTSRHDKDELSYKNVVSHMKSNGFYVGLHVAVAKLFAEQMTLDKQHLTSNDKTDLRKISLAAKWAPSAKGMHDRHTRILSTIAEAMSNRTGDEAGTDREALLKHAREDIRMSVISPLRKFLDVVERQITAKTLSNIKYDRVPSVAMNNYASLFAEKDPERFKSYIEAVSQGTKQISGATLLPSTLIKQVLESARPQGRKTKGKKQFLPDVLDAQWNTLVKRIKDSGTLENSIAVCDTSGSMGGPQLSDGTVPCHSAVGLSLLVAEVTAPPFGGMFITFSEHPQVQQVGGAKDSRNLAAKVKALIGAHWGMNTDFVAVFERLILPMAVDNKLKQEDMVKRIFVFSDMQFDRCGGGERWSSSFERIKKRYAEAGYEMPQLVFWNLNGGSTDSGSSKPVTATEEGVLLVSGYSQAMLKVFLDNGQFDGDAEEEEEKVETKNGDGGDEAMVVVEKKKRKVDSITLMRKAISHEAYQMLKVVD